MSCVVSLIHNDELYLGADSGMFLEDCILPARFDKVFWNGPFLIGAVGSVRSSQVIKHGVQIPDLGDRDPVEFLVNEFTENMREVLNQRGRSTSGEDGDAVAASILVGFRDHSRNPRLFMVGHDFSVIEPTQPFFAVGAGADAAMGYIEGAWDGDWNPDDLVKGALTTAGKYSTWVREPYRVNVLGTRGVL